MEEGLPLVLHRNKKGKNVLSELRDPDLAGKGILSFLNAKTAAALRGTSAFARNSVTEGYLGSKETIIRGSLAQWRRANPNAIYANISGRNDLTDADFVHLRGIKFLNMSGCNEGRLTDAAFSHLRGIHTLKMSNCRQMTDAAFAHLVGIHTLDMAACHQNTITDGAFAHLRGIHTLIMLLCDQATITDAAFAHLRGIRELDMQYCNQQQITGNTLHMLGNEIEYLCIRYCNADTIRNANLFFGVTPRSPVVTVHMHPVKEEEFAAVGRAQRALPGGMGTWGGRRTRGLRMKRKSKKIRRSRYTRKNRGRR